MPEDSLAKLPIFSGMSSVEIKEALGCACTVEVEAGEHIITQGKMVQNLWFIREGRCEVKRRTAADGSLVLAELGPGMQFGEMSFFHPDPHSADVVALTSMQLLCLTRPNYDRLAAEGNPIAFKLAINSLEQLAERLRRTDKWITELVLKDNHQPTTNEWTSFREIVFRGK